MLTAYQSDDAHESALLLAAGRTPLMLSAICSCQNTTTMT